MVYKQNWIIPTVIVIALLSVWMGVASGQNFSIQLIPQHSVIQGSVTLRVTGIPTNNQTLVWYKGEDASKDNKILNIPFNPATLHDSGLKNHERIRPFPNGSLLIFNLEKTDEGNYILTKGPQVQTCVYLKVYGEETEPSGSDVGTIIGLGIGAVLLFALVAVFISFLVLRRQRQKITICLDVTTNDKDAPRKETPHMIYENVDVPQSHMHVMTIAGDQVKVAQESDYQQLTHKDIDVYSTLKETNIYSNLEHAAGKS